MKQTIQTDPQLTDPISPAYQRFLNKLPEHATLDISKWGVVHILGYFCARYKKHYGVDYTFRFNNPAPSKSYEVYRIKSLAQMLSSDPTILKDYIDWLFETEVVARKKRITALGFITNVDLVNKYKFLKLAMGSKTIDRATKLPKQYIDAMAKHNVLIFDYGTLAFVKQCVDAGTEEQHYADAINELKKIGMDLEILKRVK
jgi:hypothetical protein